MSKSEMDLAQLCYAQRQADYTWWFVKSGPIGGGFYIFVHYKALASFDLQQSSRK
jgi:hypothetical protein